nr:MAG TPA: hypothetical protein [Caudoviricetes sp.]
MRPISYFHYLEVAILTSFSYSSSYSHSLRLNIYQFTTSHFFYIPFYLFYLFLIIL